MATADDQPEPLRISVSDLAAASSFYLALLKPLGYQSINQVEKQTSIGLEPAVGLGPENTSRVDLYLSQSPGSQDHYHKHKAVHVVFPATTEEAVRDFHAAALRSGGKSVLAPTCAEDSHDYKAKIIDIDENTVEVVFYHSDGKSAAFSPQSAADDEKIQEWQQDVAVAAASDSHSAESSGWTGQVSGEKGRADAPDNPRQSDPSGAGSRALSNSPAGRRITTAVQESDQHPSTTTLPQSAVTSSRQHTSHGPPRRKNTTSTSNSPPTTNKPFMRAQTFPVHSSTNHPRSTRSRSRSHTRSQASTSTTRPKTVVGALLATAAGGFLAYKAIKTKDDSEERERSFSARIAARDRLKAEAKRAAEASEEPERGRMGSGRDTWRTKARSSRRDSFAERVDRDSGYYSNAPVRERASSPRRVKYRFYEPSPERRHVSRGRSGRSLDRTETTARPIPIKYTTSARARSPNTITPPSIIPPPSSRPRTSSSYRSSRSPPEAKPRSTTSTTKAPPSSYPLKTTSHTVSRPTSAHSHQSRFSTTGQRTEERTVGPPTSALTAKALSSHTAASSGRAASHAPSASRGILDELSTIVPDDSISCAPPPGRRPRKESDAKMRGGERRRSRSLGGRLLGVVY